MILIYNISDNEGTRRKYINETSFFKENQPIFKNIYL